MIKILLDNEQYTVKPNKQEVGRISKRLPKQEVEMTLEEFSKEVSQGKTWLGSTFGGKNREKNNFVSAEIVALDFDNGLTVKQAEDRLHELDIKHSFFYYTFSHTEEKPKFRIVFHIPIITDKTVFTTLIKALMEIFPESDKACKDCTRMFYGTNKPAFNLMFEKLSLTSLHRAARSIRAAKSSKGNIAKSMKTFDALENGREIRTTKIKYRQSENSSNFENELEELPFKIEKPDFNFLASRCTVFDCFLKGRLLDGDRLHYWNLLGIALNLQYFEGGEKLYNNTIAKYDYYEDYHIGLYHAIKNREYRPQILENFSPYDEDWKYHNLLEAHKRNYGRFIYIDQKC